MLGDDSFGSQLHRVRIEPVFTAFAFFQRHPGFDRVSNPAMDAGIEKRILDMENLDRRELKNMWGMFGGKYMPSVLYRVRMIAIDSDAVTGRRHIVSEPTIHADPAKGA